MPAQNPNPPPAEIRTEISYDPKTGRFDWLVPRRGRHPGRPAGNLDKDGYRTIMFAGRTFRAHRLAWWMIRGEWVDVEIDHENGKPDDNRLVNLRPATKKQNAANKKSPTTNTSGYRGVVLHHRSGRWNAQIGDAGKVIFLGSFGTAIEAARAFDAAALERRGEFARLNVPIASTKRADAGTEVQGRLARGPYRKRASTAPIATPSHLDMDWGDIVRSAVREGRVVEMDLRDYPLAA